jgi:polyisoprenoid-binding protein YceI
MLVRYAMVPERSRFTVQAFAGGLLSFVAHSPTFTVRDFRGELRLSAGAGGNVEMEVTVRADSLELIDQVRPQDRDDIETRMRKEVLEVGRYPEIRFRSGEVVVEKEAPDRFPLRILGELSLHGVTKPVRLDALLVLQGNEVRLTGGCPLRLSDFRIAPVTALEGTIKLKDQVRVSFDVVAQKASS